MTRDQFQVLYDQGPDALFALFEQQAALLAALTARVQELEARLNQDSHNSHKPPSSDGLAKKPTSLRQKTGRKPGAQPGHPGRTLCQIEQPDEVLSHAPTTCFGCGAPLSTAQATVSERRQVFDLPPLKLLVREHRLLRVVCPHCQRQNQGAFPSDVSNPVQYGPHLKALVLYLMHYQLLPFARTKQLLADLFGSCLCEGTLAAILSEGHQTLKPVEAAIKEAVGQAEVTHVDETGMRIHKRLHWLHTSSTSLLTFYAHHPKRGRMALGDIGILPTFEGCSVHDAWPSYFGYACSHALCNAHLLRELTALQEQTKQSWPRHLKALLLALKRAVERAKERGAASLSTKRLQAYERRYERLVEKGLADNPPYGSAHALPTTGNRGRPKQSTATNLLLRLQRHRAAVLAFAYDFAVPFDNNLAERDIRMVKVRQKVSGCFRSPEGASQFCRIRGYISTLRKQGLDVMQALQSVFARQPVMPKLYT